MRKTDRERRKKWVRVLAVVLAILLIAGTLVSVLPIFEAFAEEEAVNRYEMAVTANLTAGTARVREKLTYTNTAGKALDHVMFNLWANLLRRENAVPVDDDEWNDAFPVGYAPGGVDFISVSVNGAAADWAVSGDYEQFLRVACSLEDGESAVIEFEFTLVLSDNRWALGYEEMGYRLISFYPTAAVYDQAMDGFVLNSWGAAADPAMSDPADYALSLTLDAGWDVASSGVITGKTAENGRVTWTIEAAGARDLALAFSRRMNERVRTTESGVTVRALASTALTANAMAEYAARIVETYERWLGGYPYETLDVVETDLLHGMSRSGVIFVPSALCGLTKRGALEEELSVLCARQWFGGEVGSNPENEPWMNDTLSHYFSLLYYEEREGYNGYLKRLNAEVLDALQITLPGGLVVDSHASRFTDYGEYELVVIDRGMAVMHELRAMVGRETFLEALGRYVSGNAGRIASIEQFVAAFNETTGSTWGEYIVAQMHDIGDYVNSDMTWFE